LTVGKKRRRRRAPPLLLLGEGRWGAEPPTLPPHGLLQRSNESLGIRDEGDPKHEPQRGLATDEGQEVDDGHLEEHGVDDLAVLEAVHVPLVHQGRRVPRIQAPPGRDQNGSRGQC